MLPPTTDRNPGSSGMSDDRPALAVIRAAIEAGNLVDAAAQLDLLRTAGIESVAVDRLLAELLWAKQDLDGIQKAFEPMLDSEFDPPRRAVAAFAVARTWYRGERYIEAAELALRLANELHAAGVRTSELGLLQCLAGNCALQLRQLADARVCLRRGVSWLESQGASEAVADGLLSLSLCAKATSDWDEAEALNLRALRIYQELNAARQILAATTNLAVLRLFRGWFHSAWPLATKAVALADELGDVRRQGLTRVNLALLMIRMGDRAGARAILAQAIRLGRTARNRRVLALAYEYAGECAWRDSDQIEARRWLARAIGLSRSGGERDIEAEASYRLAEVARDAGDLTSAQDWARKALTICESIGDEYETAVSRRVLASILVQLGRPVEAAEMATRSIEYLNRIRERFELAEARLVLTAANGRSTSSARAGAQGAPAPPVPSTPTEISRRFPTRHHGCRARRALPPAD